MKRGAKPPEYYWIFLLSFLNETVIWTNNNTIESDSFVIIKISINENLLMTWQGVLIYSWMSKSILPQYFILFKYFFRLHKKGLKSHFEWLSATGPPPLRRITWSLVQERSVRWWRHVIRQSEKKRWQALCLALTIAPDLPINPVNSATSRVRMRVASWRRYKAVIQARGAVLWGWSS